MILLSVLAPYSSQPRWALPSQQSIHFPLSSLQMRQGFHSRKEWDFVHWVWFLVVRVWLLTCIGIVKNCVLILNFLIPMTIAKPSMISIWKISIPMQPLNLPLEENWFWFYLVAPFLSWYGGWCLAAGGSLKWRLPSWPSPSLLCLSADCLKKMS